MAIMIQSTSEHILPRSFPTGRAYSSDVERRAERLRRILADIDFALGIEIQKLKRESGGKQLVPAQVEALREAHRQRRKPYVQKLAGLSASAGCKPVVD
jgi:hypothetical protein